MADSDNEIDGIKASLFDAETEGTKIIQEIAEHTKAARKAMRSDVVNTLALSNELVELSILLQRFADREASMGYVHRWAKDHYERTREGHKVRLVKDDGLPAGVADSMKIELSKEEFEVYNQAEYSLDQFKLSRKATEKTLDAIRSKLSYEKANEQRT